MKPFLLGLTGALFALFVAGVIIVPQILWHQAPDPDPTRKPCGPRPYPPESLRAGESGIAWIDYTTGPDGEVVAAEVSRSSGHTRLDTASLQHIKTCRFRKGGVRGTILYKWYPG